MRIEENRWELWVNGSYMAHLRYGRCTSVQIITSLSTSLSKGLGSCDWCAELGLGVVRGICKTRTGVMCVVAVRYSPGHGITVHFYLNDLNNLNLYSALCMEMDTMTCAGLALRFDDVIICERKWMPTRIQLKFLGWTKRQHLSQAATWTAQQKWIHVNPFGHVSRSLSLLMLAEHDRDWHCNPSIAWVWMVFPLRVYEAGGSERNSALLHAFARSTDVRMPRLKSGRCKTIALPLKRW